MVEKSLLLPQCCILLPNKQQSRKAIIRVYHPALHGGTLAELERLVYKTSICERATE